jgi:hypothetical protein
MSIVQLVIVGMILIIIATVTLAVLSYGAFKVRERRAPKRGDAGPNVTELMFFERVRVTSHRRHQPQ